MKQPPPTTAAHVPEEWTDMVRGMVRLQGQPLRGPSLIPVIEIKSLTTNLWHLLMLPSGGYTFTTTEERDSVLKRLEGA